MNFWLMKSEPAVFSFQDLRARPERTEPWDGVRNYQARNFMRDEMRVGDPVLFYHSNVKPAGVAGIAEVAGPPRPDPTAFDPLSPYFDPKSDPDRPRWFLVDLRFKKNLKRFVPLDEMRTMPELRDMLVLRRGNRLSITPVSRAEFRAVEKAGMRATPA